MSFIYLGVIINHLINTCNIFTCLYKPLREGNSNNNYKCQYNSNSDVDIEYIFLLIKYIKKINHLECPSPFVVKIKNKKLISYFMRNRFFSF